MRFFLVLFLSCVFIESFGQKILIGPLIGGQVSIPAYDDKSYSERYKPSWLPGFQGGVSSVWKASERFALASDFYYTQFGKKITGDGGATEFVEYHQQLGTSVLFRVTMGDSRFKYHFGVGPNVRYWLKSNGTATLPELFEIYETYEPLKYTLKMNNTGSSTREVFYITEPNRFQLGLDFNVGVLVPIKQQWLGVDLRYVWGHTNMAKPSSTYTNFAFFEDNLEHSHQAFQLSFSYLFAFDLFELSHKGKSNSKNAK